MIVLKRLFSDQAGVAITEFALISPFFLLALFGVIEGSRVMWTKQTLDEVAYATARCTAVSSNCDTIDKQRTFATTRASSYGVTVLGANVAVNEDTTCKSLPNSKQVTVTLAYESPLDGFVPGFPTSLESIACYPVLG